MNYFWKLMITIRDFSYNLAVKRHGTEHASSYYKHFLWGFLFSYIGAVGMLLVHLLAYFGYNPMSYFTNPRGIVQKIAGLLFVFVFLWMPTELLMKYLLKKIEPVAIQTNLSKEDDKINQRIFVAGVLLGLFFMWGFSFIFVSYLRHVPIHLWGWAPNEGLPPRTFKDDFGF